MSEMIVILEKINKFDKFNKVNKVIKSNIKLLYVCSDHYEERNESLVTNEGKIYIYDNCYGILGVGHQSPVQDMINEKIIDFKNSFYHTIAQNSYELYNELNFWGNSGYSGKDVNSINENIIDFCFGSGHTLVLTSKKQVYAWGDNDKGQVGNKNDGDAVSIPFEVNEFNGEKVCAISCGYRHSMVLTESGCVYSWGDNSSCQLGIINGKDKENKPKRIQIENAIKKISCGQEQSLLLSVEGNIYIFGSHYYRNLRIFTIEAIQTTSIKLNQSKKVIEIASHCRHDTPTLHSENGLSYVWVECKKESLFIEQKKTQFECFEDIFAEYFGITAKSLQYLSHNKNYFVPNGKYKKHWIEISSLGKGSYGEVFKVEVKDKLNTYFAMKAMETKEEIDSIKELANSSLILKLDCDHLVRYYDVWYENDLINGFSDCTEKYTVYIRMELCDKTLKEMNEEIKKAPKFYSNNSFTNSGYCLLSRMTAEILEGVKYLHNYNIIHRDLHPINILVKMQTNRNCIKIADFGLAVVHEIDKPHTEDVGLPNYAAPEVLDSCEYDTKADIHNLGVILSEMFGMKEY